MKLCPFLSFFPPPIWLEVAIKAAPLNPEMEASDWGWQKLLQLPGLLNEREMKFSFTETSGFWVSLLYPFPTTLTKGQFVPWNILVDISPQSLYLLPED